MTEHSTNGPLNGGVPEQALEDRAAELSAQMARRQPPIAETAPEATAAELTKRLELIEEVKRTAMTRRTSTTGSCREPTSRACSNRARRSWRSFSSSTCSHATSRSGARARTSTVISRATVYHAPTGARLGYGEGICSSREHSRAYRKRERICPACETAAVIKGKEEFGGGWLCWRKRDGCGAKFPDGDERIEAQEVGEIENPDLPDTWNAVTKMAKKRAYADAVLSVTGASAIFTQDLGADPTEAARRDRARARAGGVRRTQAGRHAGRDQGVRRRPRAGQDAVGEHPDRARRLYARGRGASAAARRREQHPGLTARPTTSARKRRPAPAPTRRRASRPSKTRLRDGAPANPNPHGTRLRAIATARGVNDAELANLIRNAVAQGPIPTDRARNALPTMLARISEENTERTVELLDMFYPAAAKETNAAPGEVTSVDFGALEPPQAA